LKKLLWLSDSPTTTTGYATITRDVLNRLKGKYECSCLAHNYFGQVIRPPIKFDDGEKIDFSLIGTGRGKYCNDIITNEIRKNDADIFGILLDTFMMYEAQFLQIDTSPAKTFFYFPSDGGGMLPLNCDSILRKVDLPIAMSKFGQDQVKKLYDINADCIPHGVDKNLYCKLGEKEKKENRLKWKLNGKFVVGTVARNQGRKMLDRTLKAFALFKEGKDDVILLMHTDPNDNAQIFQINELVHRYKLQNRVVFTGASFFKPFTYSEMKNVYNLMDVFMLSTSGEGFGIPTVEAMSCGVPQVVTDYTTSKELLVDGIRTGELVKLSGEEGRTPHPHTDEILDGTITGSWNVERGLMSIYDCCEKLNVLYNDRKLLKKYSDNSLVKAKSYHWEAIMPMWEKSLEKLK